MEVRRQRLHDSDFGDGSAHNRGDQFGSAGIGIQPGRERGALERLEVALYALRGPCRQVLADAG